MRDGPRSSRPGAVFEFRKLKLQNILRKVTKLSTLCLQFVIWKGFQIWNFVGDLVRGGLGRNELREGLRRQKLETERRIMN